MGGRARPSDTHRKLRALSVAARQVVVRRSPNTAGGVARHGSEWYKNAIINAVLADFLTNFHGFLTLVTNHAGDDLYRWVS